MKIESYSPDNKSKVYGDVISWEDNQELFIQNGITGNKKLLLKSSFKFEPEITWFGNDVVQVRVATGSPGNYSIFYDIKSDRVSEELCFVLAFDKNNNLALLGEDKLLVKEVFNGKIIHTLKIKDIYNSFVLAQVVDYAKFDDNDKLTIKYMTNKNENKTYSIKIKTK